ncbi:MAG: hypothetical protein H6709_17375, partial [Kofleriaceae bacterium]|nr:hypothetical protein [Kofleriaceae bacterium]
MLDVVDGSNEPRVETTTDGHTDQDQTWPMARLALPRPGEVRDRAGIADDVASTFRIDRLVLPPVARVVPMPADDADDAGARRDVDARGTRRPRRIALLVAALIAVTTVAIAIARAGGADAPTRATPSPGADGADGA